MKIEAKTLIDIYRRSVSLYADRRILGTKRQGVYEWITYRDYHQMVEAARAGLAELGVKKGDKVAVISDNCVEWSVMAFAVYGLGALYVPMYEAQLPGEWEFIINDCEATLVLGGSPRVVRLVQEMRAKIPNVREVVLLRANGEKIAGTRNYEDILASGKGKHVDEADVSPEDLATLIYTSGTTGKPKGVMLSHGNLTTNVCSILEVFPISPEGELSLAFLPWAHSFGNVAELLLGFASGGAAALAESPNTILANLAEVRPTILLSVPRVWNRVYSNLNKRMEDEGGVKRVLFHRALKVAAARQKLKEKGEHSLRLELEFQVLDKLVFSKVRAVLGGRLKYAASAAAALSPEVARFVSYLGIEVCEGWGLTETSPACTFNRPGKQKIGTVGPAIPGVRVTTIPAENAPEGQGELVVYGPNVMKGYYKRPDENAKVMLPDGGFRTGDLGFVDADGYVAITGRVKEQYKLENGKYVAPAPLEEQLKLSPYIAQAFIHGANKPHNVALVVLNQERLPGWAEKNGLGGKTLAQLCDEPKVKELIREELERLSKEFKGFERVEAFTLLAEEFTSENGMLTQTLKIKRAAVMERYGQMIEALYARPSARASA